MGLKKPDRVHKKLFRKLLIYLLIFLLALILSVIHQIISPIAVIFPIVGFLAGVLMGIIVSRISKIIWDVNGEKIIARMDYIGAVILLLYIIFIFNRNSWIESLVHFHNVNSISLAVIAGVMLGRVIQIRKNIINLLLEDI